MSDENDSVETHYLALADACTLAEIVLLVADDAYPHKDGNPGALRAYELLLEAAVLLKDARRL